MTKLEIRTYQESDEAQVSSLWHLVFPDDPPRNAPARVIQQKLSVQRELFFVGVLDGRVVGTVLGGYDGHRGWIYHLAVHPDHRRAGIGRQIMQAAEAALLEHGCPKINLQVRSQNDAVVAFYESLGYAVEDRISLGKAIR